MTDSGQNGMKNVTRIDNHPKHTYGWLVRIYRHGQVLRKFFSDNPHGGKEAALEAALTWRDAMYIQHPVEDVPFHTQPMRSNTTGVHGVSETFHRSSSGAKLLCFVVYWTPQRGKRKTKRFYFHHFDTREEALEAAAAFRKEKEAEIRRRYQAGKYEPQKG